MAQRPISNFLLSAALLLLIQLCSPVAVAQPLVTVDDQNASQPFLVGTTVQFLCKFSLSGAHGIAIFNPSNEDMLQDTIPRTRLTYFPFPLAGGGADGIGFRVTITDGRTEDNGVYRCSLPTPREEAFFAIEFAGCPYVTTTTYHHAGGYEGDIANVTCNRGFSNLTTITQLQCVNQTSGPSKWVGSVYCNGKKFHCPPVVVDNGLLVGKFARHVNETINGTQVQCNVGHVLVATNKSLRCNEAGSWSSNFTCTVIANFCPPLAAINGKVTGTVSRSVFSSVNSSRVTCWSGYSMHSGVNPECVGSQATSKRTCYPAGSMSPPGAGPYCLPSPPLRGMWRGTLTCSLTPNFCPMLTVSNGEVKGLVSRELYTIIDSASQVLCNAGHTLKAADELVCVAFTSHAGVWVGEATCIVPSTEKKNQTRNIILATAIPGSLLLLTFLLFVMWCGRQKRAFVTLKSSRTSIMSTEVLMRSGSNDIQRKSHNKVEVDAM